MRVIFIGLIAVLLVAGCSKEAAEEQVAAEPKKERPPHCFFKDADTKGWALKIAGDQAVVTGRGFRSDARYKVVLLEPKIIGRVAEIRPSIALNDTGFATEDNWWALEAKVPAAAIDTIEVRCGSKLVASLPLTG
ncbi:MAG: hypothetical protein ABIS23_04790 [Sphingomicrobium sp.]